MPQGPGGVVQRGVVWERQRASAVASQLSCEQGPLVAVVQTDRAAVVPGPALPRGRCRGSLSHMYNNDDRDAGRQCGVLCCAVLVAGGHSAVGCHTAAAHLHVNVRARGWVGEGGRRGGGVRVRCASSVVGCGRARQAAVLFAHWAVGDAGMHR
jgi:hypothetical protein